MTLHVLWPDAVRDPRRPSGGNVYDVELTAALRSAGEDVHEHRVVGPDDVGGALAVVPDRGSVLVDGLLGLAAPDAIEASDVDAAASAAEGEESEPEFDEGARRAPEERVPALLEALLFVSDGPTDEGALGRALGKFVVDCRDAESSSVLLDG